MFSPLHQCFFNFFHNEIIMWKERKQREKLRKARIVTAVLSLAFVVSLVFAVLAVLKSNEAVIASGKAERQAEIADSAKIEAINN